jgi:sugar phosphate permease
MRRDRDVPGSEPTRYRWAVLAAGTAAQASFAGVTLGLPVLAPVLRIEFGLSLRELGLVLSAPWIGATVTFLAWGLVVDRYGERPAIGVGLTGSAACLLGAAYASHLRLLVVLLALAGAFGASVHSASGRAVMRWFNADERGLALGIRQTAIPLGGVTVALVLPSVTTGAAFLFLAVLCLVGAVAGLVVLRRRELVDEVEVAPVRRTLRDGRLWRLSVGSSLYVYAQIAVIGYGVVFLHDQHGFSGRQAALVVGAAHVLAVALRVAAGRWSDLSRSRIVPLRRVGVAVAASVIATGALANGPVWLLVPALALAGALSQGWNGLAFTAAAELAGQGRSGVAIGVQHTVLYTLAVAAPMAFAASVSASTWAAAFVLAAIFPLVGSRALRPLAEPA